MSPEYRAVLHDPGDLNQEMPRQILGSDPQAMNEWIIRVLADAVADDACVVIYKSTEREWRRIPKRGKVGL